MPGIANPMDALLSLQPAIDSGGVKLQRAPYDKKLKLLVDFPGGEPRTTYALLEGGIVQCIVQFLPERKINGIPCLSIGVATMEPARRRGLASDLVPRAIKDMQIGLRKNGVSRFYVEAIVSISNHASQKVAERALGPAIRSGTDHFSGEPILQFAKLFE